MRGMKLLTWARLRVTLLCLLVRTNALPCPPELCQRTCAKPDLTARVARLRAGRPAGVRPRRPLGVGGRDGGVYEGFLAQLVLSGPLHVVQVAPQLSAAQLCHDESVRTAARCLLHGEAGTLNFVPKKGRLHMTFSKTKKDIEPT